MKEHQIEITVKSQNLCLKCMKFKIERDIYHETSQKPKNCIYEMKNYLLSYGVVPQEARAEREPTQY